MTGHDDSSFTINIVVAIIASYADRVIMHAVVSVQTVLLLLLHFAVVYNSIDRVRRYHHPPSHSAHILCYYNAAFNAPCVGHRDDESQARVILSLQRQWRTNGVGRVGKVQAAPTAGPPSSRQKN